MHFKKLKTHSRISNRILLFAAILFISFTPVAHASLPTDHPAASATSSAEGVLDEIQIAGSSLKARGWVGAGDSANPVTGIRLLADGVEIYSGGFEKQPRPDVAQAKGQSNWLESGFLIQAPLKNPLPEGPRKFAATALLKNGERFDLRVPEELLTVGPALPATPAANPPQLLGQLDEVVLEGNQLKVRGWVASADPAQQIQTILLKSGEETLYRGEFQIEERPDVAKALGKPDLVNSGWIVRLDWSGKPAPSSITPHFEMETGEILSLTPLPAAVQAPIAQPAPSEALMGTRLAWLAAFLLAAGVGVLGYQKLIKNRANFKSKKRILNQKSECSSDKLFDKESPKLEWLERSKINQSYPFSLLKQSRNQKFLYLFLTVSYVILCIHLPVSIVTIGMHDDAKFISDAVNIASGKWLGNFTNLTLAKGPFYSIFLAANYYLGFPATLSISLLYSFSCYLLIFSLRNIGMPFFLGISLYALLLFQPALMPIRIIRDNVYTSLTLIVIASAFLVVSNKSPYKNAVLCGLALAAFSMTREEGVWIAPGLLVLLLAMIYMYRRGFYRDWKPFKMFLVPSLLVASFLLPISIISWFNYLKYDFYGVVDFKGKNFKAALNALQSVVIGEPIPYVPVSTLARKQIYLHSPSFSELQQNLEDENNVWKKPSAEVYPHAFNDYAGGWFMWAFRDAVAARGYYINGVAAEKFYSQIAAEIIDAQRKGFLPKIVSPVPFMPPLSAQNLMQIPKSFWGALKYTAYQTGIPLTSGPSFEPIAQLNAFRFLLGYPKSIPAESERNSVKIFGWYYSKNDDWLKLTSAVGEFSSAELQRCPSPDLVKHFNDPKMGFNRFSVTVSSNSSQFIESDSNGWKIPIEKLLDQKNGAIQLPSGNLWIDKVEAFTNSGLQDKAIFIKEKISAFYQSVTPFIIFSGLACFLAIPLLLFFDRNQAAFSNPLMLIFSVTVAVLFFSRIIIVVLVDATSFPAINYLYLGPAFVFPPIFSFIFYTLFLDFINKKFIK